MLLFFKAFYNNNNKNLIRYFKSDLAQIYNHAKTKMRSFNRREKDLTACVHLVNSKCIVNS